MHRIRHRGRRAPAGLVLAVAALWALGPLGAATEPAAGLTVPSTWLSSMKWRPVGPANMGGRVADIAVDPRSPYTYYVALGTGGLMKTTDNGTTWQGVFEKEAVASIGAVAVAPSDPNVVWVGTGEANGRNSSSWGDGVYRSGNGGSTWTNTGLRDSHAVARLVIHPTDPNVVYAAALGHLWGYNAERGVFKTSDGGRSWTHSLKIDERVGCVDLVMDPSNPQVLYAAMYHRLRTPWSFVSGGTNGGVYKTADAGRTWRRLGGGLPSHTGRIGLDVSRSDPRIVFAVIESDDGGQSGIDDFKSRAGGVFRSEDAGESWKRVNPLTPRSFYFSQIRVDPGDWKRVYVLGFLVHVSDDGGLTFRDDGAPAVHVDHHAMWIDPRNTDHLLLGNDGGVYASYNRGRTWDFHNNMAAGEFYRITVDHGRPYRIAGGLQDNFNWIGPSATRSPDGITNADWRSLGGGDGFYVAIDPTDPDVVYAEAQQGYAYRLNLRTGQRTPIRPEPKEGSAAFRFHWAAPLLLSPHDPTVLYLGGNRVFKLTERGDRWAAISPDLSAQDPNKILTVGSGAENHGTVYALAESPLKPGILWAGTDDGRLWLTRDDGASWADLTASLLRTGGKVLPSPGLWISRIEASHHAEGTAYVAIDGHTSDLFAPFAFATDDFGRTWSAIAGDLPAAGPVKVVREDPRNRSLLFAGTEFGIFASFDRGRRWTKLDSGLPTVAVDDILVHPRDRDLVIATHGRSLYVLDDIGPLQELSAEAAVRPLHLFSSRGALQFQLLPEGAMWSKRIFTAPNPPFGAFIDYFVRDLTGEQASIVVADPSGATIRKLTGPAVPGVNRVVWDLGPEKDPLWDFGTPSGQPRLVPPGTYTVTVSVGGASESRKVEVQAVPGLQPE